MSGTIAPFPKHVFLDNNGNPAVGYQLFTYIAGTTTKLTTYTESDLLSSNTNPIVLDAAGRATIFLAPDLSYKFVLAPDDDTDPPVAPLWTVDNVDVVPSAVVSDLDTSGIAGEAISVNDVVYLSDGSGSKTLGRWYKAKADNFYSSVEAAGLGIAIEAITGGSSGTIRLEGKVAGLAGAAGAVYYVSESTAGAITTSLPAIRCIVGQGDSALALVRSSQATYFDAIRAASSAAGLTNMVLNGDMDLWPDGVTVAPQYWAFTGTGATIARCGVGEGDTTTLGVGTYCTKLISGSSAAQVKQSILTAANISYYGNLLGRYYTVQAKVKGAAGVAKLFTFDGTTTVYSDVNVGTGAVETLRVRVLLPLTATELTIGLEVATGTKTAYFGGVTSFFSGLMPAQLWAVESDHRIRTRLFTSSTGATSVGAGLTTLETLSIPVMTQSVTVLKCWGILANNGNTKTLYLTFNGAGADIPMFSSATAMANNIWVLEVTFTNYGFSTTARSYQGRVTINEASGGSSGTIFQYHFGGDYSVTANVAEPILIKGLGTNNADLTLMTTSAHITGY